MSRSDLMRPRISAPDISNVNMVSPSPPPKPVDNITDLNSSENDVPPKSDESPLYENYVLNNIRNLVNDSSLNDVTFIVENEELYGIRSLFASQSIVFKNMLYGSMMESNPSNYVILNDLTIDAFKYLRNTFYNIFGDNKESSESQLKPSMVVNVLFAAQKYLIKPLITKCINYIKQIEKMDDWYQILYEFEKSTFQYQSKLYLDRILNENVAPYIFQYKSLKFIENEQFKYLNNDTILIIINSDHLAAKEDEIWDSLIKWVRFNAVNGNKNKFDDESKEKELSDEKEKDIKLNAAERELMNGFIKYIRFNQMDAKYLKQHIVDKNILPLSDIINIMFARENGKKWKSAYNDKSRMKSKTMDSFQLNDICLSLEEIKLLKIGDLIDFRDFYGLFCPASIIEVNHNENKIKIHYNNWGSTYDEWYHYKMEQEEEDINDTNNGNITLTQKDRNQRIVKYGSITNRKIKRQHFKQQIADYNKNGISSESSNECEIKLPLWFWKKNENYIDNKHLYLNKWLNAKIIGYKSAVKYSDHIKIGIYINEDHFEYWCHPDNNDEIRPFRKK